MAELTSKQKVFCDEYLKHQNSSKAIVNAGYSSKHPDVTGAIMLSKPVIKEYLKEQLSILHEKNVIDRDEILSILSSVCRGDQYEDHFYIVTKEGGFESIPVKPKLKDRLEAIKLMSKILRFHEPAEKTVVFDMGTVPTKVLEQVNKKMKKDQNERGSK